MTLGYARYLHPLDHERPRAGTVGRRLTDALVTAGLVATRLDYGIGAIRLTPSGALQTFCDTAGLFKPSLQLAVYGDTRTFTNPFADRGSQTQSFCPVCDTPVPTKGHLKAHPRTGMKFYVAIKVCPTCEHAFDADTWPQTAEPVAFQAHLTVGLVADGYEATHPSFTSHVPELIRTVEKVLEEPVIETIIASTGGDKRLFHSTVLGMHPVRPTRELRAKSAWARRAQTLNI